MSEWQNSRTTEASRLCQYWVAGEGGSGGEGYESMTIYNYAIAHITNYMYNTADSAADL